MKASMMIIIILIATLFLGAYDVLRLDTVIRVYKYEQKIHIATIDSLQSLLDKHKECIHITRYIDTTKSITKKHKVN